MDKAINDSFPAPDMEISCCPICSNDEFLLSEDHGLIICIDCGPVSINSKSNHTLMNQFDNYRFKSITILH